MHPVNIFLFPKTTKPRLENFTKVRKIVNNFWHNDGTEKLQSWSMDDFKNVHHFAVASFWQKFF